MLSTATSESDTPIMLNSLYVTVMFHKIYYNNIVIYLMKHYCIIILYLGPHKYINTVPDMHTHTRTHTRTDGDAYTQTHTHTHTHTHTTTLTTVCKSTLTHTH